MHKPWLRPTDPAWLKQSHAAPPRPAGLLPIMPPPPRWLAGEGEPPLQVVLTPYPPGQWESSLGLPQLFPPPGGLWGQQAIWTACLFPVSRMTGPGQARASGMGFVVPGALRGSPPKEPKKAEGLSVQGLDLQLSDRSVTSLKKVTQDHFSVTTFAASPRTRGHFHL